MLKRITWMVLWFGISLCSVGLTYGQSAHKGDWFLDYLNIPQNREPATGKKAIIIAIVDDGVRTTHRDLKDFIWTNPKEIPRNHIDDDGNGFTDDIHG